MRLIDGPDIEVSRERVLVSWYKNEVEGGREREGESLTKNSGCGAH